MMAGTITTGWSYNYLDFNYHRWQPIRMMLQPLKLHKVIVIKQDHCNKPTAIIIAAQHSNSYHRLENH